MLVYLRDGFAQTIGRAATLRQKLQTKCSISASHSILTPGQPVPALTLQHEAPGRVPPPCTRKSCFNNNNNNNNNRIQRRYSRFFTISSQRRELSPTRMIKWPRRNRVQITCNTSSADHVQVSCYVPLGTKGQLSY